jgi:hypothetical protein
MCQKEILKISIAVLCIMLKSSSQYVNIWMKIFLQGEIAMNAGISKYPFNTTVYLRGKNVFVPDNVKLEEIATLRSHVSPKKVEFLKVLEQILASINRLGGEVKVYPVEPDSIYFEVSFVHSTEMDIFMDEFRKISEALPA